MRDAILQRTIVFVSTGNGSQQDVWCQCTVNDLNATMKLGVSTFKHIEVQPEGQEHNHSNRLGTLIPERLVKSWV